MVLFNLLKPKPFGIDAGSKNLRISNDGQLIFDEPSILSFSPESNKVSGIGNSTDYTDPDRIIKPIDVVISDFHALEQLLRMAIQNSSNDKPFIKPPLALYFNIPTTTTNVDIRTYRDSAHHTGAVKVFLVQNCYSAAIGMDILNHKKHFTIIDFSESKVEISVLEHLKIVKSDSIRLGTNRLREAIQLHLSTQHHLNVTDEDLNHILESLPLLGDNMLIQKKTIDTSPIYDLIEAYLTVIDDVIKRTILLSGTIREFEKVYFTGGGSQISWIIERLTSNLSSEYSVSKNPSHDAINGLIRIIQNPEKFKDILLE